MSKPRVTVLLPVYNGERYVQQAVDSILAQTLDDFEFIIVNDGSTDSTAEILAGYRDERVVIAHHETNQGIVPSLNHGLELARGTFIARQDADDISLPHRLERQVRLLENHPRVVIAGSAYYLIDEHGTRLRTAHRPASDTHIRWDLLFHNSFLHTAVMLRADTLRRHGLRYDARALHAEDYDLWSRLLRHGEGCNSDDPLLKHRIHEQQISSRVATVQARMADRIAQANLARLGVQVSAADISTLRHWYYWFPRRLSEADMRLCRLLLGSLNALQEQPASDPVVVRGLRRRWIDRMLAAIPAQQPGALWRSGLLSTMLRDDSQAVRRHLAKRITQRLRRVLQKTASQAA